MNAHIYYEKQKFRNPWIWAFMIFMLFVLPAIIYFAQDVPQEEKVLAISIILTISIILSVLFMMLKLEIWISELGISYKFHPVIREKHIEWNEIDKIEVAQYHPIKDYGGWGIRMGFGGRGMAYNVAGKWGIQIRLKNDKQLMLGTQKPEEVKEIISQIV